MNQITPRISFISLLEHNFPQAVAWVTGNYANPQLSGLVKFYQTAYAGILVEAEVFGLPNINTRHSSDFYAMHIHENGDCSNNFDNTGEHYNPKDIPHPYHLGDLLPLLGNQGYAWSSFFDRRLRIDDIIGRSVIIHNNRDDFSTQPSGDSGTKIGCGIIMKNI